MKKEIEYMQDLYKLSEYYESIISFKTDLEAEIEFLHAILSQYNVNSVLDVACGVGRHSVELAGLGYEVTGVDYSSNQIKQGKKKAAEKGVKVTFIQKDANHLDINNEFDAAICMWTTLGEEPLRYRDVIKGVRNSLRDKGIFVVDNRSWKHIPQSKKESFTHNIRDGNKEVNVHIYDRYTENFRIREAKYNLNGKEFQDLCVTHTLKEKDWINVLEELGFKIVEIYHDYSRNRMEKPQRVQIVAQK